MSTSRPSILVINGPSLNLLGTREPELYGTDTLADVESLVRERAAAAGYDIDFFQSNWEGALIDRLHEARGVASGIVVNPAGYTTVSVALLDALLAAELPVVEVHLTNIHRREEFRRKSLISGMAQAVIAGCGIAGYGFAIDFLTARLGKGNH